MKKTPSSVLHPNITAQARRCRLLAWALIIIALLLMVVGLGVGSTGVSTAWQALTDPLSSQIIWDIRAPRTAGAWVGGVLLGLAGALAQGLFRNPLADPFLLGSASGSSFGVALALVAMSAAGTAGAGGAEAAILSSPFAAAWSVRLGLTGAAFIGGVLAVVLTLVLARGVQHTYRLLLAGVVVGMMFGAMTAMVNLIAPETLQAMQGFMLGSTGFVGWSSLVLMAGIGMVCMAVAIGLASVLDGLTLGEATAASLGLRLVPMRAVLVAVIALATATAVAQTGLISFVGLVAPHLVRAIVKTTHAWLLPLAGLMGGLLLLVADVLARSLLAPQEIPVGILTAVLGGGYLLWLMHRRGV